MSSTPPPTSDVFERPRDPGIAYVAFVDCASGLHQDSFTLAIAHCEYGSNRIVIDVLRERKPIVPSQVVIEYAELLRSYGISQVVSDDYGKGFHGDESIRNGFLSRRARTVPPRITASFLPLLTSGRARLLDSSVLRSQLTSLERHVSASNKELIRHPQTASAHDDCATACAGAAVLAASRLRFDSSWSFVSGPSDAVSKAEATQQYVDNYRRNALYAYMATGGLLRL